MGGLAGGSKTQVTTYSGLQVQSTSAALPIPIVWGANTLSPMCIFYNDFKAKNNGTKTGGKGGIASGIEQAAGIAKIDYYCSIMLAICEGPLLNFLGLYPGLVWQTSSIPTNLATLHLSLVPGYTPQVPWPFLTSNHPSQALNYNGIAYLADSNFDLGPSASVGSMVIEVLAQNSWGTGVNTIDAEPSAVILDFLTNEAYGVGFPAASVDLTALAKFRDYCWAQGICFSPALTSQEAATAILDRWLKICNATAVWSSGLLRFLPLAESSITGHTVTWTADTTALYDLTDEDFAGGSGSDPVTVTRSDPYTIPNRLSYEVKARGDFYGVGPIEVWDQAAIDRFGLRVGATETMHEICDTSVGNISAQLLLQRGLSVRRTFQFKLSWEFGLLDPMDVVTLTDPAIGLLKTPVRIREIQEDSDGLLSITAEEWTGTQTAVAYPTQDTSSGLPTDIGTAVAVNDPIIFEPPGSLTANADEVWIALSPTGGDQDWAGATVWVSADGTSYAVAGTAHGAAPMGVTTAPLPGLGGTLSVDISESGETLASTSAANAAAGATLCTVGNEFLAYETATLTGPGLYTLTGLHRGLYGTIAAAEASGSPFAFLNGPLFKYKVPGGLIGTRFWLKFQSFNIFGATEDLSTCVAYQFVVSGSVAGPVTSALQLGMNINCGRVTDPVTETDSWGTVSGPAYIVVGLGTVV